MKACIVYKGFLLKQVCFVHAHCLRNEQCACAYDLNKQDGHQRWASSIGPGPDKSS